jgi:hypothetical protein
MIGELMDYSNEPMAKEVFILRNEMLGGQPFLRPNTDGLHEPFHIVHEMEVDGKHYALMRKHGEYYDDAYLFRMELQEAVHIEDEAEWEKISEAVDEWFYFNEL